MKKGIIIYPDSNPKSGLGHVIRCINLANYLSKNFKVFIILDNSIIQNDKKLIKNLNVLNSIKILNSPVFLEKIILYTLYMIIIHLKMKFIINLFLS